MQAPSSLLNTTDHSRDSAGFTYVYPVVSRRAGGVSIGINLNPNNACNWRCIYCQVPDLKRGTAPTIDLQQLETELRQMLHQIVSGDYMQRYVPKTARVLHDIALSGNGEPTSAQEFVQVIALIDQMKRDFNLPQQLKTILITNGSLIHRPNVQTGLKQIASMNGEVWLKFDRALAQERLLINNTRISLKKIYTHIQIAASLCPTWLQTCLFNLDGLPPTNAETAAYLDFLQWLIADNVPIKGVMLYSIARPSLQPEAARLTPIDENWLLKYRERIEKQLNIPVKLSF